MHTIKLKMEDKIYHNVMFVLKNLNVKGLEIEEIEENISHNNTKDKLKKLFATKKVNPFKSINDPMQWQRTQRDEW
jgi:hypothetical protein